MPPALAFLFAGPFDGGWHCVCLAACTGTLSVRGGWSGSRREYDPHSRPALNGGMCRHSVSGPGMRREDGGHEGGEQEVEPVEDACSGVMCGGRKHGHQWSI